MSFDTYVSPDMKGFFSAQCKLNILNFEKENLADFWWEKDPEAYIYMKYAMTVVFNFVSRFKCKLQK